MCHATGSPEDSGINVPKGRPNKDEPHLDAAIRETYEETGLDLCYPNRDFFHDVGTFRYRNKNKELHLFMFETINEFDVSQLKCTSMTSLGYPEVDWYRWYSFDDATELCHHTAEEYIPLIKKILKRKKS